MYKTVKEGRGGIVARVVADSVSESGKRITTVECEYPRFILAELNTHRLFSRNSMSSRAVPVAKMIEQVRTNPAIPIHWGVNQAGMQADSEMGSQSATATKMAWIRAADKAAIEAQNMAGYGAHKQIVNRLLEPFQMMKTVITATEWDNFFYLRRHKDAQPEIKELADCIYSAMAESEPEWLKAGEWHTPYVEHIRNEFDGPVVYGKLGYDVETALKISASCCAQVSYRVLDNSLDKALVIYDRLIESKPVHSSPFEHQATPMELPHEADGQTLSSYINGCMKGATHTDLDDNNWSGNLKGWIQYRHTIPNNTCWEYDA